MSVVLQVFKPDTNKIIFNTRGPEQDCRSIMRHPHPWYTEPLTVKAVKVLAQNLFRLDDAVSLDPKSGIAKTCL